MPLLIGLGMGALNYETQQGEADRQRELAAQTQKYSPWTGNKAVAPQNPNAVTDIAQGGVSGMLQGQQMQNAKTSQALQAAQTQWLNQGYSPWGAGMGGNGAYDPTAAAMYGRPDMLGSGLDYTKSPQNFWGLNGTGQ